MLLLAVQSARPLYLSFVYLEVPATTNARCLLFDRVVSARSGFDVNVSSSFFVDLRADKGDARVVDADFVVVWISVFF